MRMAKSRRADQDSDPAKEALAGLKSFSGSLEALIEQGAFAEVRRIVGKLGSSLELEKDALEPFLKKAEARITEQAKVTTRDLKDAAASSEIEVEVRSPYVSVGCVRLHEKKPGEWTVSVLDNVPGAVIRTSNGSLLAERAVGIIEGVERRLRDGEGFLESLSLAASAFDLAKVPVNPLMVLCSHGRGLKKGFSSADTLPPRDGLSRGEFGHLLAWIKAEGASETSEGARIHFHGATQQETNRAHQFVPVPDRPEPRKILKHRLISRISISHEGGSR
jgi:hypothetical protein